MYYTIYDKNETVVAFGNARQCRERLGMTRGSFYCMICRTESGKQKNYRVVKEEG